MGLKSTSYTHFNISVDHILATHEMFFVFTCKADPEQHSPVRCAHMKTSSGTSNLVSSIKACNHRQGVSGGDSLDTAGSLPYSEANHRALIALRCAESQRPFNMVQDHYYQMEVAMLCPGTILPSPATVSRDSTHLYLEFSSHVMNYFVVCFI